MEVLNGADSVAAHHAELGDVPVGEVRLVQYRHLQEEAIYVKVKLSENLKHTTVPFPHNNILVHMFHLLYALSLFH